MIEGMIHVLAGTVTGILSGFGIGGGTLLLVYMTAFQGMNQYEAQGINLLYFLPAALAALPSHFKNGYLKKEAILPAIGAGVCTSLLAAWLSTGLDLGLLRKCFGVFLLIIGLSELFRREEGKSL